MLLSVSATWEGRSFGVAFLLLSLAPGLASYGCLKNRRVYRRTGGGLALVAIAFLLQPIAKAPVGAASPSAKVRHLYSGGGDHFNRFGAGNVLPELDQLLLAYRVMAVIDPVFTLHQAKALGGWTTEIYRELERDAGFHALGSTMPIVYADLLGTSSAPTHSLLYIPDSLDRSQGAPVLIFLHGSGGNFKAYTWLLSQLSESLGMVIVAPSNGAGNWRPGEASTLIAAALSEASKFVSIDEKRIDVMGLSNGGVAVSELLSERGSMLRSFIFVSPVFSSDRSRRGSGIDLQTARDVLVVTGGADDRVSGDYVMAEVSRLQRRGISVTAQIIPEADHFLFFSHRARLVSQLEEWLRLKHGM